MSDFYLTAQLRKEAEYRGATIFAHALPCTNCNTYDCYTKTKKGRGCVECLRRRKAKHRADNLESVRNKNRESYNRNRPSHNPEQVLFNGVKRAGILEAGTRTKEEFQALENKALLLKLANGDDPQYTLDHSLVPAAGAIWRGRKILGRTVAANLQIMDIEKNKSKSNAFREDVELPDNVYTERTVSSHKIDPTTSTEELRALFKKHFGIDTRQSGKYEPKRPDPLTDKAYMKREALTEVEALRRGLVLEIWMAGYRYLLEPSEKNPLPKVWDEETARMVTPVIREQKNLYPLESIQKAVQALQWLDNAKHQVDQAKRVYERLTDPDKALLSTKPVYGERFLEDGLKDRIEQHFVEWVADWWRPDSKPIFDFVELVDESTRQAWFDLYINELNDSAGVGKNRVLENKVTLQISPYAVPKPEPEASFWEGWL